MIQEHIKTPLADELLFGSLAKGGLVQVRVADGKLAFEYVAAPPKSRKKKDTGEDDGGGEGGGGEGEGGEEVPELVE